MRNRLLRGFCALALFAGAFAEPGLSQVQMNMATRSYSGQFVTVPARDPGAFVLLPKAGPEDVELGETFLTISCERIKQCVLQELGIPDQWQGKVFLVLRPTRSADASIVCASERFRNAWRYRVELPTPVNKRIYIRGIVQVILTEIANRTAKSESMEIPAWLIEGLTQHIMASRQAEVILAPPNSAPYPVAFSSAFASGQSNPLKQSYETLRGQRPLSFDELSWPAADAFNGPAAARYAASAHILVYNLLRLPNGRNSMRLLLETLSKHENWQTSFFEAFSPRFQRALDVEKWWTLQTVHLMGRELENSWASDESASKLREALKVPAKVYQTTNSLPNSTFVTLQTVLREWKGDQQEAVLKRKIRDLELVRLRVSTNYVALTEDYRTVLTSTLERRAHAGLPFGLRKAAGQASASIEAARELDRLDALLEEVSKIRVSNEPLASNIERK